MTYWRMQLHPNEPGEAVWYSVQSLAAGFIGLDFHRSAGIGDLRETTQDRLPDHQKDYWAFAHEMRENDVVLIMVHHFPFALATVAGDYNYIREPEPRIGVWFRHFRPVRNVRYFGDFQTNARIWERITMTDTISPLRDDSSRSYRLIEEWLASASVAS
jgi:hypothetical protein